MSYVVSTGTVEFYRGRQNDSGGVPVAVCGVPTVFATENPYLQGKPLLGSRSAACAGHGRVRGRNLHHLPPRPRGTFDQLSFRGTDRSVGCFPCHCGTGEELRLEVLDCDGLMAGNHTPRPLPGLVRVLPSGLLVQPCGLEFRPLVALRRGLSTWTPPPGHLPLRCSQLSRTSTSVPEVGQIIGGIGGGRGRAHTPVDTDHPDHFRQRFTLAAHHERAIPISETVPIHPHRTRCRRQLTRPHHRDRDLTRQTQPPLFDRETPGGVFQRRQRLLPGLDHRPTTAFHPERVSERLRIGAQHLLLNHLRTRPQPGITAACFSEHFRQPREGRFTPGALLVHRFVPQEPAAMPLIDERPLRDHAGTQPIGIANNFPRDRQNTAWTYPIRVPTSSASNTTIVPRDTTTSCRARNTSDPSSADALNNTPSSTFAKSATNEIHTSSSRKPCRPHAPTRPIRAAVRDPPPGQTDQGPLFPHPVSRVPHPRVSLTHPVDQLVLRRHCRRRDLGGSETLCREPEERSTPNPPHG